MGHLKYIFCILLVLPNCCVSLIIFASSSMEAAVVGEAGPNRSSQISTAFLQASSASSYLHFCQILQLADEQSAYFAFFSQLNIF